MLNLKSGAVNGVYVLERYCVGGLAIAGIMDSSGTEGMFLLRVEAPPDSAPLAPAGLAADEES